MQPTRRSSSGCSPASGAVRILLLAAVTAAGTLTAGCMMLGHLAAIPAAAVIAPAGTAAREGAAGTRAAPRQLEGSPRVAIALGSGSLRGFAHIGVIEALEEAGIHPSLVVGTSAGSMVGALWASGLSAAEISRASTELDWSVLADVGIPGRGLLSGHRIEEFVGRHVEGRALESLPVPFAAVATDARTGEAVVLDQGDVAAAVRASSAIPVLFEPVKAGDRLLVDGSLAAPTPVSAARSLGGDIVVAVNVAWSPEEAVLRNPLDMLFQTMQAMAYNLNRAELAQADVVVSPDIRRLGEIGVGSREALVDVGREAGRAAVPAIREAVRKWRSARA